MAIPIHIEGVNCVVGELGSSAIGEEPMVNFQLIFWHLALVYEQQCRRFVGAYRDTLFTYGPPKAQAGYISNFTLAVLFGVNAVTQLMGMNFHKLNRKSAEAWTPPPKELPKLCCHDLRNHHKELFDGMVDLYNAVRHLGRLKCNDLAVQLDRLGCTTDSNAITECMDTLYAIIEAMQLHDIDPDGTLKRFKRHE